MTEEQKESLIAKMIDRPSSLSDDELALITRDPELRDLLEASADLSGALTPVPEFDPDEEWRRFSPRISHRTGYRLIFRVAACLIGLTFIAAIVFKMSISPSAPESQSELLAQEVVSPQPPAQEIHIEEPVEVEIIEPQKPNHTVASTTPAEPDEEDDEDIDIDEYLRIREAEIDNELALINAENIKDEYGPLCRIIERIADDDNYITNTYLQITLQ